MGRLATNPSFLVEAQENLIIVEAKLQAFFDSLTDEQKAMLVEFRRLDLKCQNAERRIHMIEKRLANDIL